MKVEEKNNNNAQTTVHKHIHKWHFQHPRGQWEGNAAKTLQKIDLISTG